MVLLTVFTPTYNRSSKLSRLYYSLRRQANNDFEWLIIDDGSTDDTKNVVDSFCCDAFPIRYYYKKNEGKHTAYNMALELSEGAYFICVDSDDWLSDDAISIIAQICSNMPSNAYVAYKIDNLGNMLSNAFPCGINNTDFRDLISKYKCQGEFSFVFKTEFARRYKFPIFDNEKFCTEAIIYDRMSVDSVFSLVPEVITICEYQPDGLTSNLRVLMKDNPGGYCLYFLQRIDMQESLFKKIIAFGKYHAFEIFAGKKRSKYKGKDWALNIFTAPLGAVFYLYYKVRRGK